MDSISSPFEETLFFNADLPETCLPLGDDDDTDEPPTTVIIYSVHLLPAASPCFPPQLPNPSSIDQATQSSEDDLFRPSEWATLVGWDPNISPVFMPFPKLVPEPKRSKLPMPSRKENSCPPLPIQITLIPCGLTKLSGSRRTIFLLRASRS